MFPSVGGSCRVSTKDFFNMLGIGPWGWYDHLIFIKDFRPLCVFWPPVWWVCAESAQIRIVVDMKSWWRNTFTSRICSSTCKTSMTPDLIFFFLVLLLQVSVRFGLASLVRTESPIRRSVQKVQYFLYWSIKNPRRDEKDLPVSDPDWLVIDRCVYRKLIKTPQVQTEVDLCILNQINE